MKKRLLLLVPGGLLGISLLAGAGTYALFRASVSNTGNSMTAGTIVLTSDRDQGDTVPGPMFYSSTSDPTGSFPYDTNKNEYKPPGGEALAGWAPGDQATRAMDVYNKGTLQAKLDKLKVDVNPAGVTSGADFDEFTSKMNVKVEYPAIEKVLYNGPLSNLLNGYVDIPPVLVNAGGGPANITFEATLDKSASNLVQGKTFVFDFTLYAEQTRNNP